MDIFLLGFLLPLIVASGTSWIVFSFVNQKKKIRQEAPRMVSYLMTNTPNREYYLERLRKHDYFYFLLNDQMQSIEKENLHDFLEQKDLFGFSVQGSNKMFALNYFVSLDNQLCNMRNEEALRDLRPNQRACILCDIHDIPLSFHGRYDGIDIKYTIVGADTKEVIPVKTGRKTNRNERF